MPVGLVTNFYDKPHNHCTLCADPSAMIICNITACAGRSHLHDLPLLLQHLKSSQLLHVVLSCPIMQYSFGALNQVAQALALTECLCCWHGTPSSQGHHIDTQLC